eukprot:1195668-Prorocentrum_minimum.AAC.2
MAGIKARAVLCERLAAGKKTSMDTTYLFPWDTSVYALCFALYALFGRSMRSLSLAGGAVLGAVVVACASCYTLPRS